MRCVTSDKWFMLEACLRHDVGCRPICPARLGRPGRANRVMSEACFQHDERLNRSHAHAFRRPPCGLIPPRSDDG